MTLRQAWEAQGLDVDEVLNAEIGDRGDLPGRRFVVEVRTHQEPGYNVIDARLTLWGGDE